MKVYERICSVNINGEWEECSIFGDGYIISMEQPTATETWYNTFGDLWKNCHKIKNAECGTTFFTKNIYVSLSTTHREFAYRVTAKKMKNPIGYRIEYKLITKPTYQFLVNNLTAPDFIKYTKYFEEKYKNSAGNNVKLASEGNWF